MKSTAVANSNIALIKYWGKADGQLFLPMNSSISMTLDGLTTTTTVEFSKDFKSDSITLNGKSADVKTKDRITKHLDFIRKFSKTSLKAKVASETNFPMGAGLASSASASASLTLAACSAAGLNLDKRQLSILARQGSGSSCRSIYGGYVKWLKGSRSEDSYAVQLADENHYDIRDVIAIVSKHEKATSSRDGMKITVETSPFYKVRLQAVEQSLKEMEKAILDMDFETIGRIAEADCLSMHATMLTSNPALIYWEPITIKLMKAVEEWRNGGLGAYFTIDAGPNVHILTLPEDSKEVGRRLKEIPGVLQVIQSKPGPDAKLANKHLY